MNTTELKPILIHALNHNEADLFLDALVRVLDAATEPGQWMKNLGDALLILDVDVRQMERNYEKNQRDLATFRAESDADDADYRNIQSIDARRNRVIALDPEDLATYLAA